MDRLLNIEPKEVVLHFEVGKRCTGMFILRNLMHTMPVAFKVQTTAPKKFVVKPPNGIIGPLGIASVEIIYGPYPELPEHYPFIQDQFVVKSVVAPASANHESIPNEWFSSRKRQVYSDMSLKVVIVGGGILRNLVSTGSMERVREVLERDVEVDSVDGHQGKTAMHIAIACGRTEMVQLLLEFAADPEIKNKEGQTALQEAVLMHDSLSTELLLSKGADTEAKNHAGCTALHFAVSQGDLEIVRILLDHGANVNSELKDGRAPLCLAAANLDKDCVKLLMDHNATLDARGLDGMTGLHQAAAHGDVALVKLLLSRGSEKEALTCDGKTPYDLAVEGGHKNLYDMLMMGDRLRSASRHGDLKTVRECLNQGARTDGQDQYGWSALHYASFKGHLSIAKYLIEKGADIECRDDEEYTALHCATEAGRKDIVQLLIQSGANLHAKTQHGLTALQIAQGLMNSTSLVRLLSQQDDTQSIVTFDQDAKSSDLKDSSSIIREHMKI